MATATGKHDLKATWLGWSTRFAAMQQREKLLVVGAMLVAILFGGYTLWIEPAQLQKARLIKTIGQQQTEQEQLRVQLVALTAQSSDPDAHNRAQLAKLQEQLVGIDHDIHGFDRVLVAPSQAPALLQTLLSRHRGLALSSLATLPPQPLITTLAGKDAGTSGTTKESMPDMPGGNIYKHGIEIKITGGYQDLLAYVADLESGSQKLLWGTMRLAADYPVSELTLTIYTLSLESTWLVV